MGNTVPKTAQRWTYADYKNWPEDERWELVHGEAFAMSSPLRRHELILSRLITRMGPVFNGKSCQAYPAPLDVFIEYDGSYGDENENLDTRDTVLEPDVIVVCDPKRNHRRGILGVPDLVVEILSDSTALRDWNVKYNLYEKAGVREYWILDPGSRTVHVFVHNGSVFQEKSILSEHGLLESAIFPELRFETRELWEGIV